MTQGRASYAMEFSSYEKVPESISQEIIKQRVGEGKVRAVDVDG
jgi:translation elongation factor EF-G